LTSCKKSILSLVITNPEMVILLSCTNLWRCLQSGMRWYLWFIDKDENVVTETFNVTVDSKRSDSGDALDKLSIILRMFFTSLIGLYYVRREEMSIKKER